MNDERDPMLEALFAQSADTRVEENFTARVMAQVEARRRKVLVARVAIVTLIIGLEWLLSSPLQNFVGELTQILSTSLVDVKNDWLASAIAPLNSIAGLIGMLLLSLHVFYRKMVR